MRRDTPTHRPLLSAIPVPDPEVGVRKLELTAGEVPSPMDPPSGCRFRTRCPRASAICPQETPPLKESGPGWRVACHFPLD